MSGTRVIVSDATHPRSYDSWILFTSDFYRLVRERLADDGVFAQWVPFHGLSPAQWKTIARTFASGFDHTSVWRVGQAYAVLLATPRTLEIDFSGFARTVVPPGPEGDAQAGGAGQSVPVPGVLLPG